MKIKHLAMLVLAIVLVLSMSACGEKPATDPTDSNSVEDQLPENQDPDVPALPAVPFDAVPGETIDAGDVRAVCPEGWFNSPVVDFFAEEPGTLATDKLTFLKGTDDSWSNTPFVSISFYGADRDAMPYEEQLDFYGEAVIMEPFMIGEAVWEGLRYNVGDDAVEAVVSIQGVGAFNVLVRLEGDGETVTFEDADIQTILTSIAY